MWDGFLSNVTSSFSYANKGVHDSISLVTTLLKLSPPPPQVETSKNKLVNQKLVANALARIPKAVDPKIAQAFNNAEGKKKKLFGNLIANPNQYPKLSESDKILVTQDVIQDLNKLGKTHEKKINSIIDSIWEEGNDSFFTEYEATVISNYYVRLHQATEKQIPVAINSPQTFECQRGGAPRNGGAGGRDTTDRRSQNAFTPPPVLFLDPRRSENPSSAQLQRSQEMHNRMGRHIASKRGMESSHPAALKPITNLPRNHSDQSQTGLTGRDARNQVLRNGMRPTKFQSGEATKAKERDLENIGKNLARLEFDLSQIKIKTNNLNRVAYRPEYGSHNQRRSEGYRDEGLNIQKDIKTLNESLLEFYTKQERAKVDAARINELQRLKSTPSLSPSAPLVVTGTLGSNLIMR